MKYTSSSIILSKSLWREGSDKAVMRDRQYFPSVQEATQLLMLHKLHNVCPSPKELENWTLPAKLLPAQAQGHCLVSRLDWNKARGFSRCMVHIPIRGLLPTQYPLLPSSKSTLMSFQTMTSPPTVGCCNGTASQMSFSEFRARRKVFNLGQQDSGVQS